MNWIQVVQIDIIVATEIIKVVEEKKSKKSVVF